MTSRPGSTASPLLPSVFPNENRARISSRGSSARASPALRDDLPLPEEEEAAAEIPYVSVTDETLLPPYNFRPFFTLVEDTGTGEVAHAAVHYVFSDDDPEVTTAVSLRALGADEGSVTNLRRAKSIEGEDLDAHGDPPLGDVLPPLEPGVQERYIIVDMAQDGQTVTSAKSLSPKWAVTTTITQSAPTFDGDDPEQAGGLMLKVEGVSASTSVPRQRTTKADTMFEERKTAAKGNNVAAMTHLVEGLRKNMQVLEKVMLGGEGEGEGDGELDEARVY